jgi:hypothetical protein
MQNGVDFWWDEFPSNSGDCWYRNQGVDGTTGSITSDPPPPPVEGTSVPKFLPEDCGAPGDVGVGDARKESVLVGCVADFAQGTYDATVCDWFAPPPRPSAGGSGGGLGSLSLPAPGDKVTLNTSLCSLLGGEGGTLNCSPFLRRI